jgi:hypothetical protein
LKCDEVENVCFSSAIILSKTTSAVKRTLGFDDSKKSLVILNVLFQEGIVDMFVLEKKSTGFLLKIHGSRSNLHHSHGTRDNHSTNDHLWIHHIHPLSTLIGHPERSSSVRPSRETSGISHACAARYFNPHAAV